MLDILIRESFGLCPVHISYAVEAASTAKAVCKSNQ